MDAPMDPEEVEAAGAPVSGEIAAETTVGAVHLTVTDLARSLDYYRQAIGLTVLEESEDKAVLGVGSSGGDSRELLALYENRDATPGRGYSGLYHFALLLPERHDLARWLAHAARDRVPMTGMSDHFVSEALYLQDPDNHGIEIYWDRPREVWEGQVQERMTTVALDVDDLLGELVDPATEPFEGMPEGTIMGHVHLRVARLPETIAFYRDVIGFGLMAEYGAQAAFFSAGGYHHHLGANSWESAGVEVAPDTAAALRYATVLLPDDAARQSVIDRVIAMGQTPEGTPDGPIVRDPSGNGLLLALA
ncbi:MAG: VOC family protein [Actinomycetota bacterium]|nr:VOC family protein [Actinomycetota bacterium]